MTKETKYLEEAMYTADDEFLDEVSTPEQIAERRELVGAAAKLDELETRERRGEYVSPAEWEEVISLHAALWKKYRPQVILI